jgi:hypothetical protein
VVKPAINSFFRLVPFSFNLKKCSRKLDIFIALVLT